MRLALLCSFILLLCTCVRAQCPTNLFIDSNQDVADFRASWPVCTSLPGNLTISGAAVTDVSGLSILRGVGGNVLIEDLLMTGITGLENLTGIVGDFTITNCRNLAGNGFPEGLGLRNLNGFLSLNVLPSLTQMIPLDDLNILSSGYGSNAVAISNFAPLSGVSGSMATVVITNNPNLTDITALAGVTVVDDLTITGNSNLNSCAIAPVCATLGAGNTAVISGNGANCANVPRVTQQCFPPCTTPDYDALEAFYNATNGDNWTENTNWLTDCDYCNWFGITCDANDRVLRIMLSNNNLNGTLPSDWSDLQVLNQLSLSFNPNLTGAIPNSLFDLPDFEVLGLINNNHTGGFPTNYTEASVMRVFQISGNLNLGGTLPANLSSTPLLETFSASSCGLTGGIPGDLDDLNALVRLQLAYNNLTGGLPGSVAGAASLRILHLQSNDLSGPIPFTIGVVSTLEELFLQGNQFTAVSTSIGNLSALRVLDLSSNLFSGAVPTEWQGLTSLREFNVGGNDFTGPLPTFPNSPDLEEYFAAGNEFSGAIPLGLTNSSSIELVFLSSNALTGCYPADFSDYCGAGVNISFAGNTGLPDGGSEDFFEDEFCANGTQCALCEHPDYEGLMAFYNGLNQLNNNAAFTGWADDAAGTDCEPCNWYGVTCDANDRVTKLEFIVVGLTGSVVPQVSLLTELKELVLPGNAITGNLPSAIWNMPNLEVLALSNNDMSGPLPDPGSLSKMKRIFLQNNGLFGALPIFGNCPDLEVILLNNNPFGDIIGGRGYNPTNIPNLTDLNLSDTDLEGFLPEELGGWPAGQLTTFDLSDNNLQGCYPASYDSFCGETFDFSNNGGLPNEGSTSAFNGQFCDFGVGCPQDCHPDFNALVNLYVATNGDDWTDNTNWLTDCDVCDWFGVSCNADGRVEALNLINNNLVGTLPDLMDEMEDLVGVNLSGSSGLTGPIPPSFFELGAITNLVLADNNFTGGIPGNIGNAITIKVLQLDNSQNLGGTLPAGLFELTNLERLTLPSCGLTGPVPATIEDLTSLSFLQLNNNDLSGNLPAKLGDLTMLTELYLQQNNFEGALPAELASLTNLTDLLLDNNELTGCYPTEYAALCGLDRITFGGNTSLPDEGSADFFENTFCATGQTCAEACPTDLTINTNQDLTDFRAQYPNCTVLSGDLIVDGMGITSVSQLSDLTAVEGNFEIRNLNLTTLPGITNIETIGGDFIVEDCPNLGTNGFGNDLDLVSVGGDLLLQDLPVIVTISPLRNVRSVGGLVQLRRIGVASLAGLQSLSGELSGLILQGNPNLTDLTALASSPGGRATALTSIGSVSILDNNALANLTGLEGWVVNGSMAIRDNDLLSDCTAEAVCQKIVQGDNLLFISDNSAGCNNVSEVEATCNPALPVSWQSFIATAAAKHVDLAWATSAEVDNDYFSVERSADGVAWSEIGRVGAGETYLYKDTAPLNGNNYYRLRQVDNDESFTFSEVRTVSFSGAVADVWPNPFRNELNLFSSEPDLVTVYDFNGRALQQIEHSGGGAQVQRMDMKQGVYLLRFQRSGKVLRVVAR